MIRIPTDKEASKGFDNQLAIPLRGRSSSTLVDSFLKEKTFGSKTRSLLIVYLGKLALAAEYNQYKKRAYMRFKKRKKKKLFVIRRIVKEEHVSCIFTRVGTFMLKGFSVSTTGGGAVGG